MKTRWNITITRLVFTAGLFIALALGWRYIGYQVTVIIALSMLLADSFMHDHDHD